MAACKNAVTFVPLWGAKVLAALAASLAQQGAAGHLIQFEVGSAPSSSPVSFLSFLIDTRFLGTRNSDTPLRWGVAVFVLSTNQPLSSSSRQISLPPLQ